MKKKTVPGMLFHDRSDGHIVLQLSYDEDEGIMSFISIIGGNVEFGLDRACDKSAEDDLEWLLLTYELVAEP